MLDVVGTCDYADFFVLATATSSRHAKALADAVSEAYSTSRKEGYQNGDWILMDLGDVVVHIFQKEFRDYYNFDKLWGHASEIEVPEAHAAARVIHGN